MKKVHLMALSAAFMLGCGARGNLSETCPDNSVGGSGGQELDTCTTGTTGTTSTTGTGDSQPGEVPNDSCKDPAFHTKTKNFRACANNLLGNLSPPLVETSFSEDMGCFQIQAHYASDAPFGITIKSDLADNNKLSILQATGPYPDNPAQTVLSTWGFCTAKIFGSPKP